MLHGHDLLAKVAKRTNIGFDSLDKNLKAVNPSLTNLIEVSFSDKDPVKAAKVVNLLTDLFKEKHLEVFSSEGNEYLERQLAETRKKLGEAQVNLSNFRQRNAIFSPDGQIGQLISQLGTFNTSLIATQNQITELEQRIAFIRSAKWTGDNSQEIKTQLNGLQAKERDLLGKYRENSVTVQNVRREIQALKDSISGSSQDLRQAEIAKVESELAIARVRAENLKRQISKVQSELQGLDTHVLEFQRLTREVNLIEQQYQVISRKLEESNAMEDMDRRKLVAIKTVEAAAVPTTPKRQRLDKPKVIMAGILGGIAAGIGLAFLLELTSACMTTPYNAEKRLGLPVMVAITMKTV